MRVVITGAGGFVGRWLVRELEGAGHDPVAVPHARLDVTDSVAVADLFRAATPDAVVHLASLSSPRDVDADPATALRVAAGGTVSILEAIRLLSPRPALLVAGSAEVYRAPRPGTPALNESSPLGPRSTYGLTKLAQESVALAAAARHDLPVVVTRAFNHIGPGQRSAFVVPAFAERIVAARASGRRTIAVGNLDVRRDFTDVRDVVRAYRLLVEGLRGTFPSGGMVVNVASGQPLAIRTLFEGLRRLAGIDLAPEIDEKLVRSDEPELIVGNSSRLTALTGWGPVIPTEQTLADIWSEAGG